MRAPTARRYVSFGSLGLAAAAAVVCAYYLAVGAGYLGGPAPGSTPGDAANLVWEARVVSAGALLQATVWARALVLFGLLSVCTYPFARLGGRTLFEGSGLVSGDWRRVLATWVFVSSIALLALVTLVNYYDNAATWAIRSDILQLNLFLGLAPLISLTSDPIGPLGGVGEIAKWFAILLALIAASFFCLRARLGPRTAVLDTVGLLFGSLLLYEAGLVLLCSNYDSDWVTALQVGTVLQWFSNVDLLCVSALGTGCLVAAKFGVKRRG